MLITPIFKAHLHVEIILGEGVLILSEEAAKVLHGGAYEQIVPLIDGQRNTDAIVDALTGKVDAARAYYMLSTMESSGYLTEATPDIPPSAAAFWHRAGIDPAVALAALRDKRVAVITCGLVDASALHGSLEAMGIQVSTQAEADLWLTLTDDYLNSDIAAINS